MITDRTMEPAYLLAKEIYATIDASLSKEERSRIFYEKVRAMQAAK